MSRPLAVSSTVIFAAFTLHLALAQNAPEPSGPNLPGAPPPPPPNAAPPEEPGSGLTPFVAPTGSSTAPPEGSPKAEDGADGGTAAPVPPPSAAPVMAPVAPYYAPAYPVPPPGLDEGEAAKKRAAEHTVIVSHVSASGLLAQGLDATDAPVRQGGFSLGVSHRVAQDFVFSGRYSFASGHVAERLPGNSGGRFGVPNDVDVLESRHVFDVTFGYVLHSDGPIRFFGVPFLGPRVPVLVNSVATRWAFEAEFGGRAGVWASDSFEGAAFIAYAPALAKAKGLADVQGSLLGELRFGATTAARAGGPFFLTFGYEGDVFILSHEKITSHGLLAGVSYALE